MVHNHNFSLTEIENMIAYERQFYIALLINHIKKENEKHQKDIARIKNGRHY